MGSSPRAVSNQRKGSRFPARPLNQPRGLEPGTSSFRGGGFAHCATWTPCWKGTAFPRGTGRFLVKKGVLMHHFAVSAMKHSAVLSVVARGAPRTAMGSLSCPLRAELLGLYVQPMRLIGRAQYFPGGLAASSLKGVSQCILSLSQRRNTQVVIGEELGLFSMR